MKKWLRCRPIATTTTAAANERPFYCLRIALATTEAGGVVDLLSTSPPPPPPNQDARVVERANETVHCGEEPDVGAEIVGGGLADDLHEKLWCHYLLYFFTPPNSYDAETDAEVAGNDAERHLGEHRHFHHTIVLEDIEPSLQ